MIVIENVVVQPVIQIKNGIMINVKVILKSVVHAKKTLVGNLAHEFVRKDKPWKSKEKTNNENHYW